MRSKAEILLVVVTMFWGVTFVIVKEALNDASPLVFIAGRFTLAGILLWFAVGEWKLKRRSLGPAMALGALLFVGYFFQTWGQEYTTPSKCAFITGFSVVLVPLIVAVMGASLGKRGRRFTWHGRNLFSHRTFRGSDRESRRFFTPGRGSRILFLHCFAENLPPPPLIRPVGPAPNPRSRHFRPFPAPF